MTVTPREGLVGALLKSKGRNKLGQPIGIGRGVSFGRPNNPGNAGGNGQNRPYGTGGGNEPGNPNPGRPHHESAAQHLAKLLGGLGTTDTLSPEQDYKLAASLAGLETGSETHSYLRDAEELKNEKEREAKGLANLGNRAGTEVGNVYKNIATSAAQSIANSAALAEHLSSATAATGAADAQGLAEGQSAAVGALNEGQALRGAPGGASPAQEALAQSIVAQQTQQQGDAQANQAAAIQQGQGNAALLSEEALAAQSAGGEAVGRIHRGIDNRVAESNAKYGEAQKTAFQKAAEAKSNRGADAVKDYLGLQEGERKYGLGKETLAANRRGEEEKTKLGKEELEQEKETDAAKLRNETRDSLSSWQNAQTNKWEAEHPNAGEDKVKEHEHELTHSTNEVLSLIHNAVTAEETFPKSPGELSSLIVWLNSKSSADPQVVAKVANTWWRKQKHSRKTGQDVNGPSLGR